MRYLKISQNKPEYNIPTLIVSTPTGFKYKSTHKGDADIVRDGVNFDADRENGNQTGFLLILDKGEEIV